MTLLVAVVLFLIWCVKLDSQICDYELVQADNRNIIFVGRSRAGKSTAISVLKDKDFDPGLFDILRGTRDATVQSFTMKSHLLGNNLHFNIMDTPGLFERAEKDDRRTNEVILDVIKKCIDMEITKINHVYFVMSALRGLADEDLKAFELFSNLFLGMEQKISVILSFAQEITEDEYDHYIDQFKNKVPELRPMYEKINGRIFFLGAAKKSKMANMSMLMENVHKQRAALFEHIIQQNTTYNVKLLKVYQENLSLIQKVRDTLAECCDSTKKCIDLPKFDAFIAQYKPVEQEETENEKDEDDYDGDAVVSEENEGDGTVTKEDL